MPGGQGQRRPTPGPGLTRRGLTLVELVVVMALLGMLASFGATRLLGGSELQARSFADATAQLLGQAQRLAVAQRATVYVQLQASPGRVALCLDAACAQPLPATPGGSADLTASGGLGLQSPVAQLSFDGMGRPDQTQPLELAVLLADGSNSGFGVRVQPDTGHVQAY